MGWGRNLRGLVWEGMSWLSALYAAGPEGEIDDRVSEGILAELDVGTVVSIVPGVMLLGEGGERDMAWVGRKTDKHVPLSNTTGVSS